MSLDAMATHGAALCTDHNLTVQERDAWAEEMLARWRDLRDEVRAATASDGPEAEWAQYAQQDLYGETVRSMLPERELDRADGDDTDEDVDDRFRRHCARDFRLGLGAPACAREWRAGGAR